MTHPHISFQLDGTQPCPIDTKFSSGQTSVFPQPIVEN